jgi:phosphate/sulfate permease
MRQRRATSLIESILNCVIGVGVATAGQIIIFPFFDIHVSLFDTGLIALIFTGISIVRSYALRRLFEWLRVNDILP